MTQWQDVQIDQPVKSGEGTEAWMTWHDQLNQKKHQSEWQCGENEILVHVNLYYLQNESNAQFTY